MRVGINGDGTRLSGTLDHLRWISALAVLVGHAREVLFVPHFPPDALPVWAKALYFVTNFQKEAVIVFFVLSGVLIGGKLMEYAAEPVFPLGRYAVERLTRLYVVLLPALALSLLPLVSGACIGSAGAWLARHGAGPTCRLVTTDCGRSSRAG